MRKTVYRLSMLGAMAASAVVVATAEGMAQLPPSITPYVAAESEIVPVVSPGDQIAIACGPVEQRAKGSDVRVVLTISAVPGESMPGYKKVLATDAQLLNDAVRVRIPDVPDLGEHTVDLNVYVVDDKGSQRCAAGHMKIT